MAGTINLAMTQQFDMDGRPLSGGLLYFFVASTTTPQTAFKDLALTLEHPNPIELDSSGRVPMFYLADGNIKIRLATEGGLTVLAEDNLLVIGPSSGGGGGGAAVDPNSIYQTGDFKARYGTGPVDGFVRANGNTIGKTGSGATERADTDDCRALFEYLWQFSNIVLDTAKGGTATLDFDAGRQLFLPDLRGRVIAGMDDMGATGGAAGRLTAAGLGVAGTTVGNAGGAQTVTLTTTELPAHTHTQQGSFAGSTGGATPGTTSASGSFTTAVQSANHTHSGTTSGGTAHQHAAHIGDDGHTHTATTTAVTAVGGSIAPGGGGTAFPTGGVTVNSATTGVKVRSTAGTAAGADNQTATETAHTHTVTTGNQSADHTHNGSVSTTGTCSIPSVSVSTTISGATTSAGSGTAFSKVPPAMVLTHYIKL